MAVPFTFALAAKESDGIVGYLDEYHTGCGTGRARIVSDGRECEIFLEEGYHLFVEYDDTPSLGVRPRSSPRPQRKVAFMSLVHVSQATRTSNGVFFPPLPDSVT